MTFSVIIPVYNVAPYLRRAVKSVRVQDFSDWEIVLVDDGSSDGSGVICDQLVAADVRIKIVHQQNQGVVAARMAGFNASSGDWILFLDGDDELSPDIFPRLSEIIDRDNPDIIRFAFEMGHDGGLMDRHAPKHADGVFDVGELIRGVQKTPLELVEMCIGDKLYRRSVCAQAFADMGDVRIKHSEDGLFALASLLHAKTLCYSAVVGYRYLLRSGSAVSKFNVDLAHEKEIFLDRILTLFERSTYYERSLGDRMRSFHAYEAVSFIFYRMLQWKGSARQVCDLMRMLNETDLPALQSPELTSLPRRIRAWLMLHPTPYLIYRFLSRAKRAL